MEHVDKTTTIPHIFQEDLTAFFLFAFIAVILNMIASRRGFFNLLKRVSPFASITFLDTCICLLGYFSILFLISPIAYRLYSPYLPNAILDKKYLIMTVIQFQNVALILLFLAFFSKLNSPVRNVWKDPELKGSTSYIGDIGYGFLTFFIAVPTVLAVNQLCEIINFYVFNQDEIDQIAVRYLKNSLCGPLSATVALFSIIIAAPIIEEFIFRGYVQSYLKRYLGCWGAILLASAIFSLMHFSLDQKASNFPLLVSLFAFSLYLGFIYEKRRSLIASITLHALFNTVNVIRIVLETV